MSLVQLKLFVLDYDSDSIVSIVLCFQFLFIRFRQLLEVSINLLRVFLELFSNNLFVDNDLGNFSGDGFFEFSCSN